MKNIIIEALEELGVALADHNHQWSLELRTLYEKAVKEAGCAEEPLQSPQVAHTIEEDFQHFLSYSGLSGEDPLVIGKLRQAFEAAWESVA